MRSARFPVLAALAALVAAVLVGCSEAGSVSVGNGVLPSSRPAAGSSTTVAGGPLTTARPPATTVLPAPTTVAPTTVVAPTTTAVPATTMPSTTTILPTTAALGTTVTDPRLFLLSDSVMGALGYTQQAKKVLGGLGWHVTLDFEESRSTPAAAAEARKRRGDMGQVVVVQIGNNYGGNQAAFGEQLCGLLAALDGVDEIVLLTVQEFRPNRAEVNAEIRAVAAASPDRITVLDWNATAQANPNATAKDGLHLSPAGARLMAELIGSLLGPAPAAAPAPTTTAA